MTVTEHTKQNLHNRQPC